MDYYKAFRNPAVRPNSMTTTEQWSARAVHLLMAASLIWLTPMAVVLPPAVVLLTWGEHSRLVEEEALDALNYAFTAVFVLGALNLVRWLFDSNSNVGTVLTLATVGYTMVGVVLAWQAQKKVGDHKPYHFSYKFIRPVWFNPATSERPDTST